MSSSIAGEKRFTGWHFLAVIVAFFGVVIAVNVGLAVVAARSWTGIVVEDSYASGQDFNEKVQLAREQDALGWHSSLTYDAGIVRLAITDASGAPLGASDVSASFTRQIGDADDQTVALRRQPDGSFAAPARLAPGNWRIVATAQTTPHGAYERRTDIVVK